MTDRRPLAVIQRALVRALPDRVVFPLVEWRHGLQEPELRHLDDFVEPGRTCVDVGAWMGPWTRALARRSRVVHAVEPQPGLARFLRKVAPGNVRVHEAAVGREPGTATLVVDRRPGRDQLARLDHATVEGIPPEHRMEHEVRVIRLDDLSLEDVAFVKIDVEGRELDALAGATGLLSTERPAVLVEVEQRHIAHPITDVFDVLAQHGLDGWFLVDGTWLPIERFDLQAHQLDHLEDPAAAGYLNNFLFLPRGAAPGRRRS
jgi:FkbM family methyltransferase